ncbi:prolyl 4-hydroxylase subunit alpha-1-like, partial [Micropterus dolomieu]|uniref:prolyl 4-hydroxylase subunit alpha-1-like n=1 Tax=Micropterus dolomieu TaxID=147949 RepID=UPI001E8D23F8
MKLVSVVFLLLAPLLTSCQQLVQPVDCSDIYKQDKSVPSGVYTIYPLGERSAVQVANYGVGGQYEPHFDFGRKDEPDAFEELGTGNRIATWLLYMSDVQAGGATVFTDVGASVRPKKVQFTLVLQLHQASRR